MPFAGWALYVSAAVQKSQESQEGETLNWPNSLGDQQEDAPSTTSRLY